MFDYLAQILYKNRADLCKEAIRGFLRNLAQYEELKKTETQKKK